MLDIDAALKKNYYIATIAAFLAKELTKNPFKKFMKFFPVIEAIYPSIYDHHVLAITNKLKPSILTYNGPGSLTTKQNRIKALALTPKMFGYHRDEYPYASTDQGGNKTGKASVVWADPLDNVTHGGFLSGFYRIVSSQESFFILLVPTLTRRPGSLPMIPAN